MTLYNRFGINSAPSVTPLFRHPSSKPAVHRPWSWFTPRSEPFYRAEPWLRAALPEHILSPDGSGLLAEETRLFGIFDKIIAVGALCHSLLTAKYGVSDRAVILLEPTFPTPPPTAVVTALAPAAPDSVQVTRDDDSAADPLPRPPPRFISVGTLCPRKGQLGLIAGLKASCAAHPKALGGAVLTLIGGEGGDPAYAAAVKAAASESSATNGGGGGQGHFTVNVLGSLPHDQTLQSMSASDAFLLNSSLESWAVAPVEAALGGIPVLSTRVGALSQSLPAESTLWVGGEAGARDGADCGGENSCSGGGALASVADWKHALFDFSQMRGRLQAEAARAVPGLIRRFGQAAAAELRARAVRALLKAAEGGSICASLSLASQSNGYSRTACQGGKVSAARVDGYDPSHGPGRPNGSGRAQDLAAEEAELVRRATAVNALACVCAACIAVCGAAGAAGGLAALVAAQLVLLVSLAPPLSPANTVTIFRSFIPPAVIWWRAASDFSQVRLRRWWGL